MAKKKMVVLTGAGISAESGISTFRGADGLWEGHDIMEVASPEGFASNPKLVLEFYNQRRAQLKEVKPNIGHETLVMLEEYFKVRIVTQNVDDLHERAGSSQILHLHGELRKVRSCKNEDLILDHEEDIQLGDTGPDGGQLRPHIVWFGEAVPNIVIAQKWVSEADIILIVGTSMLVYPAAGLIHFAHPEAEIYIVDPSTPEVNYNRVKHYQYKAGEGLPLLAKHLIENL